MKGYCPGASFAAGDTYRSQLHHTTKKQDLSANPFAIYNRMVVEQEAVTMLM